MSRASAAGERAALRGYGWQYEQIATLVYEALVDGDFLSLRLTDPEAGLVDDLVLVRQGRTDAYQFKSTGFTGYVSFRGVTRGQRTRSGRPAPSLAQALAEGWSRLRDRWGNPKVHLATNQLASINDHLSESSALDRPSPDHFSAFVKHVLDPLRLGEIGIGDVSVGWQPALRTLRQATGLTEEDFRDFVTALHFDFAIGTRVGSLSATKRSDIEALSAALFRRVSRSSSVVELDEGGVLDLVGWSSRPRLHSSHQFPVDLDIYAPLSAAIEELIEALRRSSCGYLAVVGPPGSGKSTLLSQALTGTKDRVVRYYAYVPGASPSRTRLAAGGFLHDIVVLLGRSGLETRDRELPSATLGELRRQFADLLDAAGEEFTRRKRRTLLVVDGLDHVDRDYPGNDGLLEELPLPSELPDGVVVIVGSRTLDPLHAHARQQLEERDAVVDLGHHRLSPSSVIKICHRSSVTADLGSEVHQRIAALSNGHPLALNYILNAVRQRGTRCAVDVLANLPAYEGDVAAQYRAVWDVFEDNRAVVEILAVCSRLRIGFGTEWLSTWAESEAVWTFRRKLLYLFRRHHDGWRFFHDSFRQFASDRTALGDDRRPDEAENARVHKKVADLCGASGVADVVAEQLYHRYHAGQHDEALALARQPTFREQYQRLRSPTLIREDITFALELAAGRADILVMLRLFLSLAELAARSSVLEEVDMPGLLYEAGLIDEAIAYCGADTRHVPIEQVYRLAARLGVDDHPAGREIFDLVEHNGFRDPERRHLSSHRDAPAVAWAEAATQYRPLATVLGAVREVIDNRSPLGQDGMQERGRRIRRYRRMMEAVINAASEGGDKSALTEIDSALGKLLVTLTDGTRRRAETGGNQSGSQTLNAEIATIVDVRVRSRLLLLNSATTAEESHHHLVQLVAAYQGLPLYNATMLDIAEALTRYEIFDKAADLLRHTPYGETLTADSFSIIDEDDVIDHHFRYWRLHHILVSMHDSTQLELAPVGDRADAEVSPRDTQWDTDVKELASRIDVAVRKLGQFDAATLSGQPLPPGDAWALLIPLLDVFRPPPNRNRLSLHSIARRQPDLMRIIVAVVGSYGNGLLQRLGDVLASRFQEQPERWPPWLKLEIAEQLLAAGAGAAWYRETLAAMERNAVSQDVQSRMEVLADLVIRYARIGEMEDARHLASRLVLMAFGVGYRKDYQFDSWVTWLGRALAEPDGDRFIDDAIWLARLLKAAEPMSEHAALSAETDLPAAVAVAAPIPAVRMFEYFVRHGTVNHLDALAALVKALVTHAETDDESTVRLAADMTSYLIAPASNSAHSDLGESLVRAAKGTSGSATATSLAKSVATRTDIFALRTTRSAWCTSLGLLPTTNNKGKSVRGASNQTEANDLILVDGRSIPPNEVASRIHSVADIVELRNQEAGDSAFQWGPIIAQQELTSGVVRTLSGAFDSESRIDVQVLVSLAEVAERNGDRSTAKRLAADIIRATHGDGWHSGGASRRAAAVAVRLDAEDIRVAVCKDLARRATAHRWFPGELFWQLDSIVTTLAPNLAAATTWPEIKAYLEGMAQTFDLAKDDVTTDHGCHWWLVDKTDDQRSPSNDDSPAAALAELAVGHLSHPTWIVRDAATSIVFRALQAENEHVIGALARFAQHDASHDTLERAGRCLAAARTKAGYRTPAALQPLDDTLANHTSQILRDLAAGQPREPYRPLSPLYRLSLPPPLHDPIGAERAMSPYDELYGPLASESKLDVNTLQAVAARYISDALTALPDNEAVLAALVSSGMQHLYPHQEAVAARTAFGRVLADLTDAGRLDHMPVHLRRRLRTSDVDVLTRIPRARPEVIPSPPEAGHSQTIGNWQEGIESRLDEYVTASGSGPHSVLIGAKTRLMVLNWGNVQEKLLCGTTVGTDQRPSSEILARQAPMVLKDLLDTATSNMPVDGDPLVVQNPWYPFHEPRAGWLAFRPDLAATLGWRPDAAEPGRWRTTSGKLAVESIWWIDGWWGRSTKAFDDTQAYGHAVVLTAEGLTDITAAFGKATRHFLLSREGEDDGTEVEPVSATRFMPLLWRPRPDDRDT